MGEGLREKSRQAPSRKAGKQSGHPLESCGSNDHTMCSRWGRCEYTVLGVNRRKVGRVRGRRAEVCAVPVAGGWHVVVGDAWFALGAAVQAYKTTGL